MSSRRRILEDPALLLRRSLAESGRHENTRSARLASCGTRTSEGSRPVWRARRRSP